MEVKKFEGGTIKDAITAVKTNFGNNAVILSTTERSTEHGKLFEVTAAKPTFRDQQAHRNQYDMDQSWALRFEQEIKNLNSKFTTLSEVVRTETDHSRQSQNLNELKFLLLEAIKSQKSDSTSDSYPKTFEKTYFQLKTMGLDPVLLKQLCKHIDSIPQQDMKLAVDESDSLESYYKAQAIRWLMRRIKIAPHWQRAGEGIDIQCLVGNSGCGKSLTAAKLAAELKHKQNLKVLLVSFDNVRLAAADQLRLYAKILDLPFETISEAVDLNGVLAKHTDVDQVIIDTGGRAIKSETQHEAIDFKELSLPIQFHLVLNTTEKENQLDWSIRRHSELGLQSLIFTKLDESWSYGEIFNLSARWSVPLSYFSVGPKLPGDIERSSRERVIERIMGI